MPVTEDNEVDDDGVEGTTVIVLEQILSPTELQFGTLTSPTAFVTIELISARLDFDVGRVVEPASEVSAAKLVLVGRTVPTAPVNVICCFESGQYEGLGLCEIPVASKEEASSFDGFRFFDRVQ